MPELDIRAADDRTSVKLENDARKVLKRFLSARGRSDIDESACSMADLFGCEGEFARILRGSPDRDAGVQRLKTSFVNNVALLVQKTWVEQSDQIIKDRLRKDIDSFVSRGEAGNHIEAFRTFLRVSGQIAFLLFGEQSRKPDFYDYAIRIDPTLGLFFWYIGEIGKQPVEQLEKDLVEDLMLVGMYFIASF